LDTKALCVTVEEMAKRLSISRAAAYGLVKRKDFPAVTIGRRILVPVACLEGWLSQQVGMEQRPS
jgi:excisionase family DNA binding protein